MAYSRTCTGLAPGWQAPAACRHAQMSARRQAPEYALRHM